MAPSSWIQSRVFVCSLISNWTQLYKLEKLQCPAEPHKRPRPKHHKHSPHARLRAQTCDPRTYEKRPKVRTLTWFITRMCISFPQRHVSLPTFADSFYSIGLARLCSARVLDSKRTYSAHIRNFHAWTIPELKLTLFKVIKMSIKS